MSIFIKGRSSFAAISAMDLETKLKELDLPTSIIQCESDTSVAEVRGILQRSKVGCIVITQIEKLEGIFTERDYLLKIAGNEGVIDDSPISEFMTKKPKCLSREDRVIDALQMMNEGGFRHVLIADDKQRIETVLSVKDLLTHMVNTIDYLEDNLHDLVACII